MEKELARFTIRWDLGRVMEKPNALIYDRLSDISIDQIKADLEKSNIEPHFFTRNPETDIPSTFYVFPVESLAAFGIGLATEISGVSRSQEQSLQMPVLITGYATKKQIVEIRKAARKPQKSSKNLNLRVDVEKNFINFIDLSETPQKGYYPVGIRSDALDSINSISAALGNITIEHMPPEEGKPDIEIFLGDPIT